MNKGWKVNKLTDEVMEQLLATTFDGPANMPTQSQRGLSTLHSSPQSRFRSRLRKKATA